MKITKITKYLLAATLFAGVVSCQNPLKDFNLQISTEVIKYKSTVRVVDIDGKVVPGATVALNSGDIQNIFNASGTRDFKVVDGLVTFGLDPNVELNAGNTVNFRIEVKAPGYNAQIAPVVISNASTGLQVVTLLKPSVLPEGADQEQATVDLSANGSIETTKVVSFETALPGTQLMSMSFPAGTQFKDASGAVVTGGSLVINVVTVDPDSDKAEAILPGGSLVVDQVKLADGTTASGTFVPASIAKIDMYLAGKEIKAFSQPITVRVPLDATYVNPNTGVAIAAGQTFELYSNSASDNTWKFEKTVTVEGSAATGFYASYTTDHLTYFMVAQFGKSCATGYRVNFSGDWMNNSSTYPVIAEAIWGGEVVFTRQYSISLASSTILLSNLPSQGVTLRIKKTNGEVIAQSVLASCGQETNVTLLDPNPPVTKFTTLQLYVRCPDKTETITLLPTFNIFYKEAGSTAEYALLGEVKNGLLRTSLLKTDGTKYHFKAHYNDRVKEVLNRAVLEDNTATVGIKPGDIMGEKAGATNLAILKEECGKL